MIATDPTVLSFNGTRFNSVELNGELWLRADELGKAAGLEPPESALLGLYEAHADQMPLRLTALAGVETPDGPRLMRVFNPLGAYVILTFLDTPGTRLARRWLLETLAYLQIDVKREIARLTEEDRQLRACFEALSKEVRELREAYAARNDPGWMEGEAVRVEESGTGLPAFPAFPDDGLVTVRQGEIGGKTQPVVDARELHGFLGVKKDYSNWIKAQIQRARLKENKHFCLLAQKGEQTEDNEQSVCLGKNPSKKSGRGGHNRIDYYLTLQGAQHLAMIANTDMGFRVRDYFIKCEELVLAWHEQIFAIASAKIHRVAPSAPAPVPPEDHYHYTHRDPLYLACLDVAERLFRAGATPRRGGSAISDNYGRLLAWLWRNAPAEGWLPVGNASHFANVVGLSRRSLARAVEPAVAWGLAERRPESSDGWPTEIRPARDRLQAALDATGMEWRA